MRKNFWIVTTAGLFCACLPFGAAQAESQITLVVAGEAFNGPPAFEVRMGDEVIGKGSVTNAIDTDKEGRFFASAQPSRYAQQFIFTVPDKAFKPDADISVVLTNDVYKDQENGRDRNLFLDSIAVNGITVSAADMVLFKSDKEEKLDFQAGYMPVYETGYRAVAKPPQIGWPGPNEQHVVGQAEKGANMPGADLALIQ